MADNREDHFMSKYDSSVCSWFSCCLFQTICCGFESCGNECNKHKVNENDNDGLKKIKRQVSDAIYVTKMRYTLYVTIFSVITFNTINFLTLYDRFGSD